MAIFKPSNLSPNLEEIDVTKANTFSAQVNTQGCNVVAYKIGLLNGYDGQEIKIFDKTSLAKSVLNKQMLKANLSAEDLSVLQNGKDYQWWIRMYNSPTTKGVANPKKPDTKVCSGYLVGSTTYVIWTKNNDKLKMDRWVEFDTTGPDSMFPILEPNLNNITLPKQGENYRERQKISWVEKELGWDKDFTKLELEEPFKYNYKNHTKFKIYTCSDQHTLNSFFVDPNDMIQRSFYVTLFDTEEHAKAAHDAGYLPSWDDALPAGKTKPVGIIGASKKIIGYGEDTGEIRVQEAFEQLPVNGNAYLLFERVLKTYQSSNTSSTTTTSEEGTSSTTGSSTSTTTSKITDYVWEEVTTTKVKQIVGGTPIEDLSFDTITSEWNVYNNTTQSFYVPDNSEIVASDILKVYNSKGELIGQGTVVQNTDGKVDIDTPLSRIPQDGDYFKLFRVPTPPESTSEEGAENTEETPVVNDDPPTPQEPVEIKIKSSTAILTTKYQLFMQPNINIFTDDDNPDEIVFENGVRLQIIKTMSEEGQYIPDKESDVTFNKLDNSQWILNYGAQVDSTGLSVPLTPKTTYDVYTSFMDSIPNAFFYAREDPQLTIKCKWYYDETDDYTSLPSPNTVPFRDITFKTDWVQNNGVEIKYFNYKLYDADDVLIEESGDIYDSELEWSFRGLANNPDSETEGQLYKIEIIITDEYDKVFGGGNKVPFYVQYAVEKEVIELKSTFDCDTQSIGVIANAPVFAESTEYNDKESFSLGDIHDQYLNIPTNKVMNYTRIAGSGENLIEIPHDFTMLSQIQLTKEFLKNIPQGGEQVIFEISSNETDEIFEDDREREHHVFTLKMGNINRWYKGNERIVHTDENILGLIHLYKDEVMVENCFKTDEGEYTVNSRAINALYPDIQGTEVILNVLQPKTDGKYTEIEEITQATPNPDTIYLLTKDSYDIEGKVIKYPAGLYTVIKEDDEVLKITPVLKNVYVFIHETETVEDQDYDTLEIDEDLREDDAESGEVRVVGEDDRKFLWVDSGSQADFYNGKVIEAKGLYIYLQVYYDENGEEIVHCDLIPTSVK